MRIKLVIALFILTTAESAAQDSLKFRTKFVWVDTIAPISYFDPALLTGDDCSMLLIQLANGSFCLVNQSDSAVKVERVDGGMDSIFSEIEINGEWKQLQGIDYSWITCGNSYWSMSLKAKHCICFSFSVPDEPGGEEVKVRLVAYHNGSVIYSESWFTHLFDYQIRQAGVPIKHW